MNKKITIRLVSAIFMITLIAWAPWWLVVLCSVAGLVFFSNYYEIILWGVVVDAVYGLYPWPLRYTIFCTILFVTFFLFRRGIRAKMRDRMKI